MSASLALQRMIRARLVNDQAVIVLVPAANITDRHGRAARFPSITFGSAGEYPLGSVKRDSARVALDLHVWSDAPGTAEAKRITNVVRHALRDAPWETEDYNTMDLVFRSTRYMPDPASADTTHGVITFDAFMLEMPGKVVELNPGNDYCFENDPNYDPGDMTLIFDNKLI